MDTTASLRYMVELAAAGMCDGPPDSVGPAERLRKLESSREAWKSSVWSQPKDFPYSKLMSPSPIALSGNLAVFGSPKSNSSEYVFLRFPSEARGISERVWLLDLDCKRINGIGLDDSQDLLIFSRLVASLLFSPV